MSETTQGEPLKIQWPNRAIGMPQATAMSLRDYFAAQALAGMLAAVKRSPETPEKMADFFAGAANTAYLQADAMLAERAK